jgi:hypothetical protein
MGPETFISWAGLLNETSRKQTPTERTRFKSNSVGFGAGNGAGKPSKRELSSPQFDLRAAFL